MSDDGPGLGNPPNGDAPRPAGRLPRPACRRRHRQARAGRDRAACCRGSATSAASTSSPPTARTSRAAWASRRRRPRSCSSRASTSSRPATTSGTSARSTRTSTRASGSCGRSTTAPTTCPAAAGACTRRSTARELAVINLQGRTYMQPIDNPFTDADRLLDEASEPLPPIRIVDFHCELTSREERARALPRRAGLASSSARTPTSSRATSGSCPRAPPTRPTSA